MHALGRLAEFQCYECQCCPGCCRRGWIVPVTEAERQAILAQGWSAVLGGRPLFERYRTGPFSHAWRLALDEQGSCVFLNAANGLCRIHERHGFDAKPLACQVYPFVFVPAGDRIEVGLRFDCLSVATNHGRPLAQQRRQIRTLAERVFGSAAIDRPAPPLRPGVPLDWTALREVVGTVERLLNEPESSLTVRLLACAKLAALLQEVRFDRLTGPGRRQLLEVLAGHVLTEAAAAVAAPRQPPPASAAVLFRQLAAVYTRHDRLVEYESFRRRLAGRWRRFRAALRFARGQGPIPRLQDDFPPADFLDLEYPLEALPSDGQAALTRFYRLQVGSLGFFGPSAHGQNLVEGLTALAATYPVLLWLARWYAQGDGRRNLDLADLHRALRQVGHQFAQSPALARSWERRRLRLLGRHQLLERLILWYG